jgi:hypothetical protein
MATSCRGGGPILTVLLDDSEDQEREEDYRTLQKV